MKRPILVSIVLLLSGCTVGPNFVAPKVSSPSDFGDPSGPTSAVRPSPVDVTWWRNFGDPELTSLMERYAQQNANLKTAAERVLQARAGLRIARADGLPNVGADAKYVYQRMSPNGFLSLVQPSPTAELQYSEHEPLLSASWDADLFGKIRRSTEAARADVEASEAMRHGVMLAGAADLAETYMRLRLSQAAEAVLRANIAAAKRRLELVTDRQAAGAATSLDVAQATSQLAQIKQGLPQVIAQQRAQSNAIALLLSEPPRSLVEELTTAFAVLPTIPTTVAVGLPSELVLRRPDVRAAMASLHAATARTGVAVASFYPDLTLSGNFGFDSLNTGTLFEWASRTFMVTPSLSIPIFQGGRLSGTLELRESQQREAAVAFNVSVLQAWHDVDTALSTYSHAQETQVENAVALAADKQAVSAAQEQFGAGATNYLNVVTAQTALLGSQERLANADASSAIALVGLYRALGGGWEGLSWNGSTPNKAPAQSTH